MSLCGCGCLQACTTTLNQFSVMGGGDEGAVDNGWEGDICFCRLYGVKLDRN